MQFLVFELLGIDHVQNVVLINNSKTIENLMLFLNFLANLLQDAYKYVYYFLKVFVILR